MAISIRKNFVYNSALMLIGYLVPLITYPYVSRVLGVNRIGICNYVDSVINFFSLFSMMGIGTLGIREIARCQHNHQQLSKVFSQLFSLNAIATLIALIIAICCISFNPTLAIHKKLMSIGLLKLVFNFAMISWLYQGLENFKYITLRSLVINIIFIISVFIVVRKADDYIWYYVLSVSTVIINAIINIVYSRHFIHLHLTFHIHPEYIKSFIILGVYVLLTSLYTSFNTMCLGIASGSTQVGYYSTATKIYSMIISIYTALTSVLLPRMTSLAESDDMVQFKALIDKSLDALISFTLPLILFIELCAPQIIEIISGKGYEGAIAPLRIIIPLCFVIGYEQILVVQILMPLKRDHYILVNSIVGALLGLLLNILLVKQFMAIGSSVTWVTCEIVVLCLAQHFVNRCIGFKPPFNLLVKNILYIIPLLVVCLIIPRFTERLNRFAVMAIEMLVIFIYTLVIQSHIIKNPVVIDCISRIRSRMGFKSTNTANKL